MYPSKLVITPTCSFTIYGFSCQGAKLYNNNIYDDENNIVDDDDDDDDGR